MVKTLVDQLPEDQNNTVISVKQEHIPTSPNPGNNAAASINKYDPGVTYILEFCTLLAIRDTESIEILGKEVFDVLQGVIRDASQYHSITISRSTFYALKLLCVSYVCVSLTIKTPGANTYTRTMTLSMCPSSFIQSRVCLKRHWARTRTSCSRVSRSALTSPAR